MYAPCRWKRQAAAAAAAVLDVKDEVVQRKRELVSTQDKMDVLIDKLYAGKEASSSLSGSIAAAASYQQVRQVTGLQVARGTTWTDG